MAQFIVNNFKETIVFIKASDVQNIVKKADINALNGKTHTEALLEHLKTRCKRNGGSGRIKSCPVSLLATKAV